MDETQLLRTRSRTRSRRITAAATLSAAAALTLAAATAGAASAAQAGPAQAPAAASAAAPACGNSSLRTTEGEGGAAMMHEGVVLVFKNVGKHA